MIRFINCIRKRADISSEEFRQFWNDPKLDAIIRRVVEYTGASGYVKNLTLMVSANELMQERRGAALRRGAGVLVGGRLATAPRAAYTTVRSADAGKARVSEGVRRSRTFLR